jgi:2-aminoadipate transaminase
LIQLSVNRKAEDSLSQQISKKIREAISRGEITAGERLPAERALARSLDVDRMTVARAYEELSHQGLVTRHVGRGSFVRGSWSAGQPNVRGSSPGIHWEDLLAERASGLVSLMDGGTRGMSVEGVVNFSSYFPDPDLFPVQAFRKALDITLRDAGPELLGYGPASGYQPLREYLAGSMKKSGMRVEAGQIVVTNGSQQGIDLVARALVDPGDRVIMENPTYTGAAQLFQWHGAQVMGIQADENGLRPDRLWEVLSRGNAKLIYLIPNFQNPTSRTMSLERRKELLSIAADRGVPILEDDFGGDLRYEGEEIPALKSMDSHDGVIYMSSFAKKLLPALRIGWVAAPDVITSKLSALKRITDWSTSQILQGALHQFCVSGQLERHLKKVVAIYRERRDAMSAAMEKHFPRDVVRSYPKGGLVIWLTLPAGVDADEVAIEARARRVLVGSGDLFYLDGGTHNNLRLVFAQASLDEIERGIEILGSILARKADEAGEAASDGSPGPLPII